jgi:KipI family sensor histidine kinase inhibitor
MSCRTAGRHALLLELDGPDDVRAWHAEVVRRRETGTGPDAVEVVPGARTLLLDGLPDPPAVRRELESWAPPAAAPAGETGLVELRVTYDGADLEAVAGRCGVSPDAAADLHAGPEYTVAFCGFSPGFAYLSGLPEPLHLPRLDTPRTEVPAGSVAVAGPWCGVYPSASPGGWLLLGRTDAGLFDPYRDPPALLPPGTRVRFRPVRG